MNDIIGNVFFLLLGVITIIIFLWEIYICLRWIAETIVEPCFNWLNDKLLRLWVESETEQRDLWEEWRSRDV